MTKPTQSISTFTLYWSIFDWSLFNNFNLILIFELVINLLSLCDKMLGMFKIILLFNYPISLFLVGYRFPYYLLQTFASLRVILTLVVLLELVVVFQIDPLFHKLYSLLILDRFLSICKLFSQLFPLLLGLGESIRLLILFHLYICKLYLLTLQRNYKLIANLFVIFLLQIIMDL